MAISKRELVKSVLPHGIAKKIPGPPVYVERCNPPQAFAADGNEILWFYLKDKSCLHAPFTFSSARTPSYIVWDRANEKLPRHMYTYDEVFHVTGNPQKRFAMFFEGVEIIPQFYDKLFKNIDVLQQFDAVFTNQKALLDQIDNGYYNIGAAPWYGSVAGQGELDVTRYMRKTKNMSIISSDKKMCELHRLRFDLAEKYDGSDICDSYGTFHGGHKVYAAQYLDDYRYHIVVENQISDGYFTEKITNCFLSMTVPIYIGAKNIGDYFNTDGIIMVEEPTIEAVEAAVAKCNEEDYMARKDAMIDNFNRMKDYMAVEDYMYNHYKDLFEVEEEPDGFCLSM